MVIRALRAQGLDLQQRVHERMQQTGKGTLLGPVLGVAVFELLKEELSQYTQYWYGILGATFGFVLQRARFCFFCIWKDWLDRRDPRGLLGILAALGIAAGIIGWVGLVVPHLLRRAVGGDPGRLLGASALGGAAMVLAADIAVRLILPERDLKLGVLTALVGAPLFLHLIWKTRSRGGLG